MSVESVREHLSAFGRDQDIEVHETSSATVELAARALGVEPALIAKTISVYDRTGEHAILVVVAGDVRLANAKFKQRFGFKARMLSPEDVEPLTGHAIGGVCPFGNPPEAEVFLDESLRRFDTVHPAAGGPNTSIALALADLETLSRAHGWVDVTQERLVEA